MTAGRLRKGLLRKALHKRGLKDYQIERVVEAGCVGIKSGELGVAPLTRALRRFRPKEREKIVAASRSAKAPVRGLKRRKSVAPPQAAASGFDYRPFDEQVHDGPLPASGTDEQVGSMMSAAGPGEDPPADEDEDEGGEGDDEDVDDQPAGEDADPEGPLPPTHEDRGGTVDPAHQ